MRTYVQTDRWKDMMNLSGAFRGYDNTPRNDSKTNENSENFLAVCEWTSVCTRLPLMKYESQQVALIYKFTL